MNLPDGLSWPTTLQPQFAFAERVKIQPKPATPLTPEERQDLIRRIIQRHHDVLEALKNR